MTHLEIGNTAPPFKAKNQNDKFIELKDFKGKKLILFFYPKDNTPGCTAAACNLRDNYKILKEKGFELLGVSPDSIRRHQNFIKKYTFPFDLISDEDLMVTKAYGLWGLKKFMGREYDGLHRTTFIIDAQGTIEHVFKKVKTKTHTEQILEIYKETETDKTID